MSRRTYRLLPRVDLARAHQAGFTRELSPSDIPIEFDVAVSEEDRSVCIELHYPLGSEEPRSAIRIGRIDFQVGQWSERLFRVVLKMPRDEHAMSETLNDLRRGLEHLRERTHILGPTMNYRVASAGLGLEEGSLEAPPAWLIDAYRTMSGGEHSSGSGRSR